MKEELQRELEAWRDEALSPEVREEFRRSAEAVEAIEREHPTTLASTLDWIEQLRGLFGDPPVDRRPWRGSDFRL